MGGKIKVSMTIDSDVYQQFKEFCQGNGMKVSTKVELLMRDSSRDTTLRSFIR